MAVGGAIFGIGWAISGYWPGTCAVGTSEGKKDALFTLLGALVGAFVFSLVFCYIDAALIQNASFGKVTLEDLVGVNGIYLAIPCSLDLLGLAFFCVEGSLRLSGWFILRR